MSTIIEKQIRDCLAKIIDPHEGKPVTDYIPKIIIKDNVVFFTIEYENLASPSIIQAKENIRKICEIEVKKIENVQEVKATIHSVTSNQILHKRLPVKGVARILLVASGKGGVGKSTIAANLAVALSNQGKRVALVDADIYGPSLPVMFGNFSKPELKDDLMIPHKEYNLKLMSMGFLVNSKTAAVWRGPMVTKALYQLIRMTNWIYDNEEIDIMLIDTPPGTGDVHLSLAENYQIDGAIIISTPQEVALLDARKAYDMFLKLNIPVIGLIENMSYFQDVKSGNITYIFGKEGAKNLAKELKINFLGEIPLDARVVQCSDKGIPIVHEEKQSDIAGIFKKVAALIL
jgi:ATP-binding protein involved in chromosome partitioning